MNACIFLFVLLFVAFTEAGDWQVAKDEKNTVTYNSSTALLDFEGTTNEIDGYIYWEGEEIFGKNNELYFELLAYTFDSGIGKRDRDMRNDVLHTEEYPSVTFKGIFKEVEKKDDKYNVVITGELFLHGVTKEMEIDGDIVIVDSLMHVMSNFNISLKDFNIEAPSLLAFIKVADEIKMELDFYLKEKN